MVLHWERKNRRLKAVFSEYQHFKSVTIGNIHKIGKYLIIFEKI